MMHKLPDEDSLDREGHWLKVTAENESAYMRDWHARMMQAFAGLINDVAASGCTHEQFYQHVLPKLEEGYWRARQRALKDWRQRVATPDYATECLQHMRRHVLN